MAVEIKSGNSTDTQTVDPTSKAARVTLYNSDGIEGTKELPVALASAQVTVVDNDVISSIDVTEYKSISLQLTGVWVGTVTFQGSNDNGTFYDIVAQDMTSTIKPYSYNTEVVGLFNVPVIYKYFRLRVTAFTSGTVECSAYGHKEDKSLNSVGQIGEVTLADETTKVIGTVNVAVGASYVSGTITSSDTALVAPTHDGSLLTGTPSVDSYFAAPCANTLSTWVVEIAGTLGGATFYFEGSTGSTNGADGNWVSLTSLQRGLSDSDLGFSANTAGGYAGNATGLSFFRVRAVGGVGVNVTIGLNYSRGAIAVNFNAPLPTGTNSIGDIGNIANLGGVAVTMGGGVSDAGTQRVAIASDGAVAEVTNLAQIGGAAVSMGGGVSDAGTQRVSIASDEPVALAAGENIIGAVRSLAASADPLLTDFYVGAGGGVNVNSRTIRTQATTLRSLVLSNYTAGARHVKIYDQATVPTAGQASPPVIVASLAASGTLGFPLPAEGLSFVNGIAMTMTLKPNNSDVTPTATAPDFSLVTIFT
jgi:hypothetical protein